MCSIVAYNGKQEAAPIILEGLKTQESRGYDSAGIAVVNGGRVARYRAKGKLSNLRRKIAGCMPRGHRGIGHTRWATHGPKTERNAHPHMGGKDAGNRVVVVHNGIITNFKQLRKRLTDDGCVFRTDTDTEVIPHLVGTYLRVKNDPLWATQRAVSELQGSFAVAMLFEGHDGLLIVARQGTPPLGLGFGSSGMIAASSAQALTAHADRILFLESGDIGVVTSTGATIYDASGKKVNRPTKLVTKDDLVVSKEGHADHMHSEIFQQRKVAENTLNSLLGPGGRIRLPRMPFRLADVRHVEFVDCGTAKHATDVAEFWLEHLMGVSAKSCVASEYRHRKPPAVPGKLGVAVTQSGETADTIGAIIHQIKTGCPTLSIVNVVQSSIARMTSRHIQTKAGPEIGVASTKVYVAQLIALAAFAIGLGRARRTISRKLEGELTLALKSVPGHIQTVLGLESEFKRIAALLMRTRDVLFMGEGANCPTAFEGALKLKEISYKRAEAFPGGEFRHGPLAMVTGSMRLIAIAPHDETFEVAKGNIITVKAKRGKIILLSDAKGVAELKNDVFASVTLPTMHPYITPIVYAVAAQLIAYHVAKGLGLDVDKPRHLAKSVTV